MNGPRRRTWAALAVAALGTLGAALAQDPADDPPAKKAAPAAKDKAVRKPGPRAGGGAAPKRRPNNVDPLTNRPAGAAPAADAFPTPPFHFKLRITGADGVPLAASYYPSQLGPNAPVVLLVHEKGVGRSGKDFEEPISDLKGLGLAEHLQDEDYAVLVVDLRGHGANPRHEVNAREWQAMARDFHTAYLFLIDRNNRRELNVAKLGVIALGDAGNLAAAWAAGPDGAVASEGRVSDLGALVLVSPVEDALGIRIDRALPPLAPRLPTLLVAGKKDDASARSVQALQPLVERQQRGKVVTFDTSLHGFKLLRLFPKVVEPIDLFLKETIKIRLIDWEPRYLLAPVAYSNVELVAKAPPAAPADPNVPAAKKKAGN